MRLRLALALCALASGAVAQEMTCVPTRDDTQRLSRLDLAWEQARKEVIESGDDDAMRRLGPVADPRVNLTRPQPTPGRYQCRTIKLGAAGEGLAPYIAYGWFRSRNWTSWNCAASGSVRNPPPGSPACAAAPGA